MFTEFQLPYGKSFITARIPTKNVSMVLEMQYVKGLANETEAIVESLRSPIGRPPLVDCVSRNDKVVVVVTDNTRGCPDDRLLPPILAELERKVPRENITILIALGLHRPMSKEQMVRKYGEDIVAGYRVVNHDINQTVRIGTTSRGTPVEVNRLAIEADFLISTGFIEPHFFAGFSGGRKSIAPGVSSLASISRTHCYKMMEHPSCRTGIIEGNPLHEEVLEQAVMAKLNFIVNVVLNKDREITHIVAGDLVQAHEKGCEIEKEVAGVKVNRKVDITVTTNGGAPLDLDLYQTCKGIDNASRITREGGFIIIASPCNEGIGAETFRKLQTSCSSPAEVMQKIVCSEPPGVQWQNLFLVRAQLKNQIYLVSELEESLAKAMMVTPVPSVEEGLEKAFKALGSDAKVAVIPEGPLCLTLPDDCGL